MSTSLYIFSLVIYSCPQSINFNKTKKKSYMTIGKIKWLLQQHYSGWAIYCMLVRCGSYWGRSPQNGLGGERTCGMTLASAYVLHHLSAT